MKRLASIIVAVVMVLTLMPMAALAADGDENAVAKVGDKTYATLIDAVDAAYEAGSGQTVTLLKNYEVETGSYTTYLLPDDSTFDLGGNTLTVPFAAAAFEGTNITIQNGRFESTANYSIWIGNGENDTTATVKNVSSNAGVNVFAATATIENCLIDASTKTYYAVWADESADITVNSGSYTGGENGVLGTATEDKGLIEVYGGSYSFGNFLPGGDHDNVVIHGGTYSGEIDSKYVDSESGLVQVGNGWAALPKDKKVENEDGSTTETKTEISGNESKVTETTTKTDAETGTETKQETVTKTDTATNTTEKVETTTTTQKDEKSGTVTETKKEEAVVSKVVDGVTVETEKTTTEATVTKKDDTTVTNETKTVVNNETKTTTETKKEVVATENVTTTEQTVTTTNENNETTVVTTKNVADKENNVATEAVVDKDSQTAKVVAEVGTDETAAIPAKVVVDATAAKADADSVKKTEVTLPPATVSTLNQAANAAEETVESVEVKTDVATLSIDNTALKTLTAAQETAEEGNLTLSVEKTDSTVGKTENATATYELKAYMDGTEVFEEANAATNGNIAISVPYELSASDNTLKVYYVTEDGARVDMNASYENGILNWTTNHFSTYEVVEITKTADADDKGSSDSGNKNSDGKGSSDSGNKGSDKTADNSKNGTNNDNGAATDTKTGKYLVVPATGDESNTAALIIMLFISGGAIAGVAAANRKRNNI